MTEDTDRIRNELRSELDHFRREVTEQLREMRERLVDTLGAVTEARPAQAVEVPPGALPFSTDELLVRIRTLQAFDPKTQTVLELLEISNLVRELDHRLSNEGAWPTPWRTGRRP